MPERDRDCLWQPVRIRQWIVNLAVILLVVSPILIGFRLLHVCGEDATLHLILIGFGPMAVLGLIAGLSPRFEERLRKWRHEGKWRDECGVTSDGGSREGRDG